MLTTLILCAACTATPIMHYELGIMNSQYPLPNPQYPSPSSQVPTELMTNELMFGRSVTPIRRNRYERRHPELNRREERQLTTMATRTPRKGFRTPTTFNRRNG